MRIIACGGRGYVRTPDQYEIIIETLDRFDISHLCEGGDRTQDESGRITAADYWVYRYSELRRIPCSTYWAAWGAHSKAAGPIRNRQMRDDFHPDRVVAFPGGRGTADMSRCAREAGIEVLEIQ